MATINGDANNNTLEGTDGADTINGLGGNDSMFGFGGNDVFDGGPGPAVPSDADVINGGNGFDTVSYANSTSAVFVELDFNRGGGDTLLSIENVDGSRFGDFLDGDNNGTIGNQLRGLDGADQLNGFSGQDVLDGGNDNDIVLGGAGEDTVIGGAGSDFLNGESGFDTVSYATSAAAVFASLATGDAFVGGDKDGLFNFESLTGSAFADKLVGDDGGNTLSGLAGIDVLVGGFGSDVLTGGNGSDELSGGVDADLLVGGAGADTLLGGAGADTFDFNKLSESRARLGAGDSVGDFVEGLDVIDLGEIDANSGRAGNQAFSFIGPDAFSGTAGELRFELDGLLTHVLGDVDGNGTADLEITLHAQIAGSAGSFVL
jgi:Ca2+-binding RTX toxin-like protein